jgi:hypothetical protein
MVLDINRLRELSGIPSGVICESDISEASDTDDTIKALRDTDYRDKDAFFKMSQLIKGLASVADKDDNAKKFLSAVSDALTTAAKKVLGEDITREE